MTEHMSLATYKELLAQPPARQRGILPPKKTRRRPSIPKAEKRDRTPLIALQSLMRVTSLTSRLIIRPEERLSIDFANALRAATLEGRLNSVWTHPANEIAGRRSNTAQIRYAIAKAMGMIDGAADFLFLSGAGCAALEAKIGGGSQQDNQLDFEIWCGKAGVPYRIFRSVDEGLSILADIGLLTPKPLSAT